MVLLAGIGFLLMPFTLHKLGPEQYGIWAIAMAFIGCYSFLDLGLSEAVFTYMAYAFGREDHEEAGNIYGTSVRACLRSSEQQSKESQVNHLQAGVQLAFTVLP
jgi:O-antigen/teichoic acid export membrane protein